MAVRYQRQKGTADILPGAAEQWQYVEGVARKIFAKYRYSEIRTPLFENYEVFSRSSGDTSDIVTKEMYDFNDKGGRHIALRPEGTAGVVRAYVENKLYGPEFTNPYKVYYMGPMFRYERPQSGRMREFHQIGVEAFGVDSPALDVETIAMAQELLTTLGLQHLKYVINTLGDAATRAAYHQALIDYLTPYKDELSEDSQVRLVKNPLRILDSKDEHDQAIVANAPSILDFLTPAAQRHFDEVKSQLTALGINYEVDADMVRGLDYYNHTIFEIMSDSDAFGGKWTTILAGGRYNGLVQELGGPEVPGVGFGMGVERLLLVMNAEGVMPTNTTPLAAYVVGIGDQAREAVLPLVQAIRKQGFAADCDFMNRKPKAQFKTANREHALLVITIGDDELARHAVQVKVMATGNQQQINLDELTNNFAEVYRQLTKGDN